MNTSAVLKSSQARSLSSSQTQFHCSLFGQRYDSSPPPLSGLLTQKIPEIISTSIFNTFSSNIKLVINLIKIINSTFKLNGTRHKISKIGSLTKLLE